MSGYHDDVRRPDLRIGDAEREAANAALGDHYAAGRLTREEFDERSARVYAARTNAELWPMFGDLPLTGKEPWAQAAQPVRRPRGGRDWFRAGFAPVLLIAIGLVVLVHLPWPLLLVVGWIWWGRTFRYWSRRPRGPRDWRGYPPQASGSRRSTRGTWA